MWKLLASVVGLAAAGPSSPAPLVDLFVPTAGRPAALEAAKKLKKLPLSKEEFEWLDVLANGWASPLDGFMTETQFLQSLHYQHLVIDGEFVPMSVPIVKSCTAAQKAEIEGAEEIALTIGGEIIATMTKPEVYEHRKEERAGRTFGITNGEHPYIKMINEAGDFLVGGKIKVLKDIEYNDGLDAHRYSPAQLRALFKEYEYDAVFAFQLRNPVHNGHALLMQDTAEKLMAQGYKNPVLLLSPLGGWTKDDDVPLDVRMKQHDAIIKNNVFGDDVGVVLAIFPSPMLYAGPAEVQWHAYARMNAGATHYIVGRDPAGMKHPATSEDIYHQWHGQTMLQQAPGLQGIQVLPFTFASYDTKAKKMAFFDPKRKEDFQSISGSKMRKMAREGTTPPEGFMDPEGWKILATYYQSVKDEL